MIAKMYWKSDSEVLIHDLGIVSIAKDSNVLSGVMAAYCQY